jgi:hypothetical protein
LNNQTVKELKKIIGYSEEDPTQKRLFKRLKKQYKSLSGGARRIFLDKLAKTYNINNT